MNEYEEMYNPFGIMNGIKRLSDGAFIPIDVKNKDYIQYLIDIGQYEEPVSEEE